MQIRILSHGNFNRHEGLLLLFEILAHETRCRQYIDQAKSDYYSVLLFRHLVEGACTLLVYIHDGRVLYIGYKYTMMSKILLRNSVAS